MHLPDSDDPMPRLPGLESSRPALDPGWRVPSMHEALLGVIQDIEDRLSGSVPPPGLPTGFPLLDDLTGGLQPGELSVIAARPGMGKLTLALDILRHTAVARQVPAALFSTDLPRPQLTERLLCVEAGVPLQRCRSGFLSATRDFPRLHHAAQKLAQANLWIDDAVPLTTSALHARASRLKSEHAIRLLVVGGLQGISPDSSSSRRRVSPASALKSLARELDIAVLVTARLNGRIERRANPRPRLTDLEDSDSLEEAADVIGVLLREECYADPEDGEEDSAGRAVLVVCKNRRGPTGDVPLRFRRDRLCFESRASEGDDD